MPAENGRITEFTDLAGAQVGADEIVVVDVSDTTDSPEGTTKRSSVTDWFGNIRVLVNLITGQIKFPATQNASADVNTLDDYDEGNETPTPTIVGGGAAGTASYTVQNIDYTKFGDLVQFTVEIAWSGHTGTGNMEILTGLSFVPKAGTTPVFVARVSNITYAGADLVAQGTASQDRILLINQSSAGAVSIVPIDAAGDIIITGTFKV